MGTLTFCQPQGGCGTQDDIAGVQANSLQLNGFASIRGSQVLTLGAGGLTAKAAELRLPVALGAPQTWTVNTSLYVSKVTGAGNQLSVQLPQAGSGLTVGGDVEVGPVNVSGPGLVQLGSIDRMGVESTGSLNGGDGSTVNLSGGAQLEVGASVGSVGSLSLSGSTLDLGSGGAGQASTSVLNVDGDLTLDPASTFAVNMGWLFFHAGPSFNIYPQVGGTINATGTVNLGGASLTFPIKHPEQGCLLLGTGQVYTLVKTAGRVTGTFAGIPDGTVVGMPCADSTAATVRINYTSNTVTATVVKGEPSPTRTTVIGSLQDPEVNQPVEIATMVNALVYGHPAGTVSDFVSGKKLPGCADLPLQYSGLALCQTSFGTAAPEVVVGAGFDSSNSDTMSSPDNSDGFPPPMLLAVTKGSSTAALSASAAQTAENVPVAYTATITPHYEGPTQPTGAVEFLEDGQPIAACAKQPLNAGAASSTAQCTTSFAASGTHAISAQYAGDGNFTGSTATPLTTVVTPAPPPPTPREPLAAELSQAIKSTKFDPLWTPRGVAISLRTKNPGDLTIRWYLDTRPGHLQLISTTTRTIRQAGTTSLRLTLNRSVRRTLSRVRHARLTAQATLTSPGAQPIRAITSFTITR